MARFHKDIASQIEIERLEKIYAERNGNNEDRAEKPMKAKKEEKKFVKKVESAKKSEPEKKVESAKKAKPAKKTEPAKKAEPVKKDEPEKTAEKVEVEESENSEEEIEENAPEEKQK